MDILDELEQEPALGWVQLPKTLGPALSQCPGMATNPSVTLLGSGNSGGLNMLSWAGRRRALTGPLLSAGAPELETKLPPWASSI